MTWLLKNNDKVLYVGLSEAEVESFLYVKFKHLSDRVTYKEIITHLLYTFDISRVDENLIFVLIELDDEVIIDSRCYSELKDLVIYYNETYLPKLLKFKSNAKIDKMLELEKFNWAINWYTSVAILNLAVD